MPPSWAAAIDPEAVVKLLLDKGIYLEVKSRDYDWEQLLVAARYGNKMVVKLLLDNGADLELVSEVG